MALGTFASIVMEQIRADQFAGLDKIKEIVERGFESTSMDGVLTALEWDKSGWSNYQYEPLIRAILLSRRPVYAGDPSRDSIKSVAKEGSSALVEADVKRLKLNVPLGEKLEAAAAAELATAHCQGGSNRSGLANMAVAQRYRDAHMADAVAMAMEKHRSALLFAGNEHVRSDRGVPWYLRQSAPGKKITSVMLVEVEKDKVDVEAYVPKDPDGKPAADYIIFTPPAERSNPCIQDTENK